jgi:hypothetical protein
MAPPSKDSIKVATDALRTEGGTWDGQGAVMTGIAGKARGLDMTRLEAGVFQVIVGAYGSIVDQVGARADEGAARMGEVADTLVQVANTYDREEQNNTHHLTNLY